jgi:hypothetical protein
MTCICALGPMHRGMQPAVPCACSTGPHTCMRTGALGYDAHKEEFCHHRGVFFHNNRCTLGMACAQAVAMRGAPTAARRLVAAPQNQQPSRSDPHEFDRHFSHFSDVR